MRYRLIPFSAIVIGGAAFILVMGMISFAFSSYIFHLQRDARTLLNDALSSVNGVKKLDAVIIGKSFLAISFRPDLLIVFVDGKHRVCVFRETDKAGIPFVRMSVRARFDRSAEPQVTEALSRVIIGVGSAFGLQTVRAHAQNLEIDVSENPNIFVRNVKEYAPIFWLSIFFVLCISIISARVLAYQALRQLVEVTSALEHLAIGDFTPQFVTTRTQGQLRTLAAAYNGAVKQVQRAFGERDRAHASMQRFISDAAHQLRTPLTVIRGYIGVLRQGEGADTSSVLSAMHQQCMLIGAMIERLILLEQWEEKAHGPAKETDLGNLIQEILIPIAQSHPERSIRIDVDGYVYAAVDPGDFRHAVTNVVENAMKYTVGAIIVAVRTDGTHGLVEIIDEGPGMKPEQAERAFDRFFRGDRRDIEGSGLGLAIAQRAIERAGGSISLITGVDRGSCFTIVLPRMQT